MYTHLFGVVTAGAEVQISTSKIASFAVAHGRAVSVMDALLQLCRPAQALLAAGASSPSAPPAPSTRPFPRDPAAWRGAAPADYVSGRLAPGTKWQNEDKSARDNRSVRDARLSRRHTNIGLELCDYRLEEGDGVLRRVEEQPHGNPPGTLPVSTDESLDSTTKPATASPLGGKAATSMTRKGRRGSDSGSVWEKAAHDLAKQRDALRGGEARPPSKRSDGDRFRKLVNLLMRQLVVSPASSPFAPSTSTLTVERLCMCRKRNRQ
jgi:hypothetical protein